MPLIEFLAAIASYNSAEARGHDPTGLRLALPSRALADRVQLPFHLGRSFRL